ncbi:hypothetical protein VOLCADRAFT_89679 [Volvox carteri f. nagariensis]|uniref:Uncharacterized protein n=1 Tax=Volvox carteri f. nagariensis TaxID=3068 RepID=D8TRT1_VOLCA|nr:uncharacterized protein VOLCADRAFT_89679 [Volvox carteri f. nagariensis]EFJ49697.1 hypothetical protein VOLCADRAFT_89679 [Volvox carteri f. nagariensis]|eukprot:XP_002949204.1 hypothetical protein VOLCADRAFT_89679 [Volvox carteri f. nagariensis]
MLDMQHVFASSWSARAGLPINLSMSCFLGLLGSSITAGQGVGGADHTYIKQFMDWLNHVMPPRGLNGRNLNQITHTQTDLLAEDGRRRRGGSKGAHGEDRGKGGGSGHELLAVQQQQWWRRSLRSSAQPSEHEFLNGAIPVRMTRGSVKGPLGHREPLQFPLIYSRAAGQGSPRRELERLLRKVLNLPSNPAVVLVNMFAMGPSHRKYWYTAERDFMEFATYYSLPAVSLKSAVLPSAYVGGAEEMSLGGIFNGGLNHPGRGGHVVIAEVLITLCTALVQQPVDGWNWTDEGRGKWGYVATEPGKTIRFKVNTQLAGSRSEEHLDAPIVLQIAHLQSYRGMSTAKLSCVSGCTCTSETIDAFSSRIVSLTAMKDIRVSQHPECVIELQSGGPSPAALRTERDHSSGSGHTNDSRGDSGDRQAAQGHKFKLMGVVVGEEPGARAGNVEYVRQESHNLWQRVRNTAGRLLVSLRLHLLRLH